MWGLGLTGFLVAVDLFCGGGGASLGIHEASGASPVVAVNHDEHAIEMHAANHPETIHFQQSVWDVDPGACIPGRMVDLLWGSPDCTHFSRAKGGKPRRAEIRSLATVLLHWARCIKPKVLMLENVREFTTWGPLDAKGYPIESAKGDLFRAFVADLEACGYVVEWRMLAACDYGTPTTRERLFLVARSDGQPIVWPEPTHGPGRPLPYKRAADQLDYDEPALSIFATKAEAKAFARKHKCGTPRRPLAEATQRRIAEGLRRFVLEGKPFLVDIANRGWGGDGRYVYDGDQPLRTVTTKASHCVVAPHLVNTRNGERKGQRPRVRCVEEPYPTITAKGSQGAVASVHLEKVAAFIAKHNGGTTGQPADEPLHTITATDTKALVQAHLSRRGRSKAVAGFVMKYYGSGSQWSSLEEPLHTIVSKARMGLITVEIDGESWAITDITMRMLTPRELARCQGFPDDYILTGSKKDQIARIGNSVCPQVVEALVSANFPHGGGRKPDQMPMFGYKGAA